MSMNILEDKINEFRKIVLEESTKESTELEQFVDNEINRNLELREKEYNLELDNKYLMKIKELEKEKNTVRYEENIKAKQIMYDKKSVMINDIISNVTYKVKQFIDSDEYETFLIDNINTAILNTTQNSSDDIIIYVTERDLNRLNPQNKFGTNMQFKSIREEMMGGCICENRTTNITVDNTILFMLQEQKEKLGDTFGR